MNQEPIPFPAPTRSAPVLTFVLLAAFAAAQVGCNGASSATESPAGPPEVSADGRVVIPDSHFGGGAVNPRIADVFWGRLVDVFGLDANGAPVPMNTDFVIAAGLVGDGFNYVLDINPVTGAETLTIQRDVTSEDGLAAYAQLLAGAEANRSPVFDNGPGGVGLFSMVPRNAAIIIRFNDLLDVSTVNGNTIRVLTGSPSVEPFEARTFADANHGALLDDGNGGQLFYPTRVIIDPAVSEFEAFQTDPPLPVNGLGLPASVRVDLSNVEVRIPTVLAPAFGQTEVLQNLTAHSLSAADNGTADLDSPTDDIVRAVRAGGSTSVTADPNNGFLRDEIPPRLIGLQPGFIETSPVQDPDDPFVFEIGSLSFSSTACARRPRIGDVLEQPGIFAQVIEPAEAPINGVVSNVRVRLILFPPDFAGPGDWSGSALGPVDYLSVFEPIADGGLPECFVQFSPGAPDLSDPTARLGVTTTVGVRFSEPMDPLSLTAFDSMTLGRVADPSSSDEFVIGQIGRSPDLRTFSFVPSLDLAHLQGLAEEYYFDLLSGPNGPRDLAGNQLMVDLPQVSFSLDPTASDQRNGGRVTRFSSIDEDEPIGEVVPLPEWTGQHFFDSVGQFIRPRPVSRFQGIADRSNAIIALMNPFPQGVQTPLSPFGCRLMHIYRYVDVGFSLTDTTNYNLDVEGLAWAPANGQVTADNFPEYEIRMGHCKHAPDEEIELPSLFPAHPNSGFTPIFNNQFLGETSAVVMHPRERGYRVDPGDAFATPTGTLMMPWPINGDPSQETRRFTWRDTTVLDRDGRNNEGVDPEIVTTANLERQQLYSELEIQTIGMPLLVEHRCYPAASDAIGNNSLDIAFAVNSSRRPFFRAFSVGGFAAGGQIVEVDPDLETRANGGFNPLQGGAPSPGQDPNVYYGAIDFVVRVSRSVSLWFEVSDAAGQQIEVPHFERPILEPRPQEQPSGTRVDLAFRGALSISDLDCGNMPPPLGADPRESTTNIDFYGNHYCDITMPRDSDQANTNIVFIGGDDAWIPFDPEAVENPLGIDGAQYYQVRASFSANPDTGLVPILSAFALSWD